MRINPIPLTAALCLFGIISFSQKDLPYTLQLRSGKILPEKNITEEHLRQFSSQVKRTAGKSIVIIQFDQLPAETARLELEAAGIELLEYIPDRAYTAVIKSQISFSVLQRAGARAIFELSAEQKMHPDLARNNLPAWSVRSAGMADVWISFPKTFSAGEVRQQLTASGIQITSTDYIQYNIVAIKIPRNRIQSLASLPFIEYMQPAPHGDQLLNIESRSNTKANLLNTALVAGGYNLKGEGVTVGVGDNSDIHYHVDFTGRNINRAAIGHNHHGTHVSGTLGAGGIRMEEYRGYVPKSTIISQAFSGIIKNASSYVTDYNMVVTNNSYGDVTGDCNYMGYYDLQSRILDLQAASLPNLQNVFAAGNDGTLTCSPYPAGFRTVLSGYQTAKNVITVGSVQKNKSLSSFSSRGPVSDGRIKPEITATGSAIISTIPWNIHGNSNGTSMATPGVSGGAALLYQYYRQLNGNANPKNGLIKALLCNGADDLGNTGPDYSFGFGNMNLLRSAEMLQAGRYYISSVNNAVNNTHSFSVPANTAQLKVMLYWNDPASTVYATTSLINDLDLELTTPASSTVFPLVLDTVSSNVNNTATNGPDHTNNIEQVVITNPATGNYTVTVKGTSVTQSAPQEYFVVYDFVPASTRLTYPLGGEAFNPGETVLIEWDSYGSPANTFTLEYSLNNGGSWTIVSSSIASDIRSFSWTVPNVQTDQALIRISKNGTAQVSSSQVLVILGIPTITLSSVQCQGYFAFQWTAVTGATDYEVFVLNGDEMTSSGTTTATNFTLSGLNKDSLYWVSVRARINANPGRRAIAESRQPNSGTCAGNISDNDLLLDAVIAPVSGRVLTSTALTATTTIIARIKNLDDVAVNSFKMRYSLNGGVSWTEETVNTAVAAGTTYNHSFATTADLSAIGQYELRVEVINLSGADPVVANNLLIKNIKQLQNSALDLTSTFLDNLEPAANREYLNAYTGLDGIDRYDFSNTASWGRARTFVNTGMAYSGSKAITLDYDGNYSSGVTNYLAGTFNLSSYNTASHDLRLDFRFKNHGQTFDPSNPNNKVWIRGNDTQPWIEAYDLFANQDPPGSFKKTTSIELSDILSASSQNFSSSFQVRWGQFGHILAADNDGGEGYTFDDIRLYNAIDDIQTISIDEPLNNNCGLGNSVTVKVTVKNTSPSVISNIPVRMVVDGGVPVIETIAGPLAPNSSMQYTFAAGADLSATGNHTIVVNVQYATDNYKDNDTVTAILINSPVINTFPHVENFESGDGDWFTLDENNPWEYGTPGSFKINRAASGTKAWKTSLTGNYRDNTTSYLYSPCYNISGMTTPTLSMSIALDVEDCGPFQCDGAFVEYSQDGINWFRLGNNVSGTNWYNKSYSGDMMWSVQGYTRWHVATTALPTGIPVIRFRVAVQSDPFVNFEGIAIDDIHVYDNTMGIYDGNTMASPVSQNITGGTNWIHFTSGGKLVASIQPNNQNMGLTNVQAFIHTGSVRFDFRQYYHNRNITIKPATTALSDSATVRFYFLDTETENLINATGCTDCSKPAMVSELGVTKYSDNDDNIENGTIADNAGGEFSFLSPDWNKKIPFDKGYYVEFKVKDFSEFWLNNGAFNRQFPLPAELISFNAKKKNEKDVQVEWKTAFENNVSHYEIEVAKGNENYRNSRFVKLGEVRSMGNTTAERNYSFIDSETGKSGARYYRLRIVDKDNTFAYSAVRPVVFNEEIQWQVYPNPSDGQFNFIYQLNRQQLLMLRVYDMNGKLVKQSALSGSGFVEKEPIDLSLPKYPSGIYLLTAESGEKKMNMRLIKK
jgi:hypothetical protein